MRLRPHAAPKALYGAGGNRCTAGRAILIPFHQTRAANAGVAAPRAHKGHVLNKERKTHNTIARYRCLRGWVGAASGELSGDASCCSCCASGGDLMAVLCVAAGTHLARRLPAGFVARVLALLVEPAVEVALLVVVVAVGTQDSTCRRGGEGPRGRRSDIRPAKGRPHEARHPRAASTYRC